MSDRPTPILQAWLETPDSGVIELSRDWFGKHTPPLFLGSPPRPFKKLQPLAGLHYAERSGFFSTNQGEIWFVLPREQITWFDETRGALYVAGDFNDWSQAVGRDEWRMRAETIGGRELFILRRPANGLFSTPPLRFKFVTSDQMWIELHSLAPNTVADENGNRNHVLDPDRTGQHLFKFETQLPLELSENHSVIWRNGSEEQRVPIRPDNFLFAIRSDSPLGAHIEGRETVFRLFAPRARRVKLRVQQEVDTPAEAALIYPLERRESGIWEVRLDRNLHGWFYWYQVEGPTNAYSRFDKNRLILDPYARAAVCHTGPGIILDENFFSRKDDGFIAPQWQDLVIAELHVRDAIAHSPLPLSADERLGFSGLTKWIEHPDCYLRKLGVNAVELQPLQEFDNRTREEYHWGYMTTNWFSPASAYASRPAEASQVRELQNAVRAFHRAGIAVIADVVYNHVGEPAHLLFIDKHYYFEGDAQGHLSNWSGCGNDFRASTEMGVRMIIDSCLHLMRAYGIDGFRFDLAELLGVDALSRIEAALKAEKPNVILIAEPWSFRGHIAGQLRDTGWASWNDGFRRFAPDFVRGNAPRETLEYFLKGSPWHFAKWPAQTVNYTESHDDRTWIDCITENPEGDAEWPTLDDRRRTHLMAALLFASIGIPMLSAGQDFMRTKRGVNNTYQRGDLNALDYLRLRRFASTHRYFADWIAFRRSEAGRLLRLFTSPSDGFFRFSYAPENNAVAALYNADYSHGGQQLLLALNPHVHDGFIPLENFPKQGWRQLADQDQFLAPAHQTPLTLDGDRLFIPSYGVSLWTRS